MGPVPVGTPSAPNPSTAMARVLLDELARCGVEHVVMAPGSRSTALALAAFEHPALQLHVEVDERSAGYLAVGVARATGRPAAVVVTSGTAVANLLPAVVEAHHDRVPLLLLTADRPPELHGTGANQTIEQLGIFGDSTRWTVDLGVAGDGPEEVARWRWTACRAYGVAVGEPVELPAVVGLDEWREPGPVHCNVPFREPTVPVVDDGRAAAVPFQHPLDGREDGAPWAEPVGTPHVPSARALDDAVERMLAASRVLVVVGGGVGRPVAGVGALASALRAPLLLEPHARVDAATSAAALRFGSMLLGAPGFRRSDEPVELVVRVGRPTIAREVTQMLERTPQLVIDAHGGWGTREREDATLLFGNAELTVAALVERLVAEAAVAAAPRSGGWLERWAAADASVESMVHGVLRHAQLRGDVHELNEPSVAGLVMEAVPSGGALVVGSSMPIRDLDLLARRRGDVVVHANRGASGIDGVVSTALGVALGSDGPTVALVGDLTLLHDTNAWLLSPDEAAGDVDVVVVVVDNDGGGIFSFLPQRTHVEPFERLFGTPHGRDLAALASLHGLSYAAPTSADGLMAAIAAGVEAGGRHLVHVRTEREANLTLHRRLREAVAEAIA